MGSFTHMPGTLTGLVRIAGVGRVFFSLQVISHLVAGLSRTMSVPGIVRLHARWRASLTADVPRA